MPKIRTSIKRSMTLQKGLMEAVSFEDINMYAEAQNKYQQLMSFYPDNPLVKCAIWLFVSEWVRKIWQKRYRRFTLREN